MAMSKFGFLLLNICTILLATRGIERSQTTIAVVAAAAAATVTTTTFVHASSQTDQQQQQQHQQQQQQQQQLNNDSTCGSETDQQCPQPPERRETESAVQNNRAAPSTKPKFTSGDIIELFNTESKDIQIVFPSIVKGREFSSNNVRGAEAGHIYHVTKTTDGNDVNNIPEKFLHAYVPYAKGLEVLCNIGDFKPARPIIVKCTVLEYEAAAVTGAMVLQGKYSVQVHATKANEEYTTTLPVWKLQRRYLMGGTI